jgi:hypothetical protein
MSGNYLYPEADDIESIALPGVQVCVACGDKAAELRAYPNEAGEQQKFCALCALLAGFLKMVNIQCQISGLSVEARQMMMNIGARALKAMSGVRPEGPKVFAAYADN